MTNQSYVYGWLFRRLEWEHTLAELHVRARRAQVEAAVSAPTPNAVSDERPTRAVPERRARTRTRSPIRGMSRRRTARKIPA
jgi:hypothetical protein